MKIAYVYDAVYPWVTGGVEKRVWELARRLASDHDVHWYGYQYWEGDGVKVRDGVTIHGVAPAKELYVNGRRRIDEALRFTAELAPSLAGEQFDIVDCQEFPYFPCLVSKAHSVLTQATLFLTWHEIWGDYWYEYLGWKGVFGKTIERIVAELPDYHLAVSEATRQDVYRLGVRDVALTPNGVDFDAIGQVRPATSRIDVLYVGRLIAEKNVDALLDAIAVLREDEPSIRCLVVGNGPQRDQLVAQADRLNISSNVTFTRRFDEHEDILAVMKAAETFVLPSVREGFGITVIEALACGTPVVTADAPRNAARTLVTPETGRVCAPTGPEIAKAIESSRGLSSRSCRRVGSTYDWNELATSLGRTYSEAL